MAVLTVDEAIPRLKEAITSRRLIPFLGAGFSMALQLPSWRELTGWMAQRLGFEPALFERHGTNPQLAEFFAISGANNWSELVYEMTRRFDSPDACERRTKSRQHKALAALPWRTIYTTNYDTHVEGALADAGRPCAALASIDDFLHTSGDGCEVIKFHGTLSQPSTIVLSESHYFERGELGAAVDQRLRADLLTNSFLFIGYGFADSNIRSVWYRMQRLREQHQEGRSGMGSMRRSLFATFGADPVQPALLDRWSIDVVPLDPSDKSKSVAELLEALA